MGHFLEPEEIPNYLNFEQCFSSARQVTGMIPLCFTFGGVTSAAIISAREKMGSQLADDQMRVVSCDPKGKYSA